MQAALASHDIKCEVVEEYSDDVEEGKVIRTDPEAGTELEKGATLTVYISKGKQKDDNENVAVPGLLGMTEDQARAALEAKGLKIGSVDSVDSSAEAGSVVWQSQDAGAEVTKGSTVNIQISRARAHRTITRRITTAAIPAVRTTAMAAMTIRRASAVRPFRFRCRTTRIPRTLSSMWTA